MAIASLLESGSVTPILSKPPTDRTALGRAMTQEEEEYLANGGYTG
jgi:hypothetical protein